MSSGYTDMVIRIFLLIPFLALVGNLVFLDYVYVRDQRELGDLKNKNSNLVNQISEIAGSGLTTPKSSPLLPISDSCPQTCVNLISQATTSAKKVVSAPAVKTPTTPPTKGEYIIPLGSGAISSDQTFTWVDVPTAQVSFDTGNYSSIKAFYFEVLMHIPNQQGELRARLIDTSTPFIYAGQVLSTQSGTGEQLSAQMPLIFGYKNYRVQLYTTIAPGVLDWARIRIVTG